PVAEHGMDVGVDQTGERGRALAVDDDVGIRIEPPTDRGYPPVLDQDGVGVEQRGRDVARDDLAEAGDQRAHRGRAAAGQWSPSVPTASSALRPPTRACGRPPLVTARATTSSSAAGASGTQISMASKCDRTSIAFV